MSRTGGRSEVDFSFIQVALVVTVILAAVTDIHSQRVPNWLTLSATLLAFSLHTYSGGLSGLLFSAAGLAFGFALLIGFYLAGGMGAGDVKLLAAVGAFVGAQQVLWVFLVAALAGGLYALVLLLVVEVSRSGWLRAGRELQSEIRMFLLTGGNLQSVRQSLGSYPKLRYAVVIALGVVATRLWSAALT